MLDVVTCFFSNVVAHLLACLIVINWLTNLNTPFFCIEFYVILWLFQYYLQAMSDEYIKACFLHITVPYSQLKAKLCIDHGRVPCVSCSTRQNTSHIKSPKEQGESEPPKKTTPGRQEILPPPTRTTLLFSGAS